MIEVDTTILIENIVTFIDAAIPSFITYYSNLNEPLKNEKLINQSITDHFNMLSQEIKISEYLVYKFLFRKDDERSDTIARPDIGVVIATNNRMLAESIFQVECKRLPIPKPYTKDRVETEYVIGTTKNRGGIERFKSKIHGFHLKQSAIIGYVESETTDYWYKKINDWIEIEIAKKSEILQWCSLDHLIIMTKNDLFAKFQSTCTRDQLSDIKIYHYLIDLHNTRKN